MPGSPTTMRRPGSEVQWWARCRLPLRPLQWQSSVATTLTLRPYQESRALPGNLGLHYTPSTRVAPGSCPVGPPFTLFLRETGLARPGTLLLSANAQVLSVSTSDLALPLLGANKVHFTGLALAALCQLSPIPGTTSPNLASPRIPLLTPQPLRDAGPQLPTVPGVAKVETWRGRYVSRKQAGHKHEIVDSWPVGVQGWAFLDGALATSRPGDLSPQELSPSAPGLWGKRLGLDLDRPRGRW